MPETAFIVRQLTKLLQHLHAENQNFLAIMAWTWK